METLQFDFDGDDRLITQRALVRSKLDQITEQVKAARDQQGISVPVFFIVPSSGDAIIAFGTVADPPDDEWGRVNEIVSGIMAEAIGLDRLATREVACAATDQQISPADQDAPIPVPVPIFAGDEAP
jgi:hypothetical protein